MGKLNIGYGNEEGFLFATNIATLAAGATTNTEATSVVLNIPSDVTAMVFEPRATASAAAVGQNVRFDLQGKVLLAAAASYHTNPVSVRVPLTRKGYNSGPWDPVDVRLIRKLRVGLVANETSAATATEINIYYRMIR